jgi:hypothetical protein
LLDWIPGLFDLNPQLGADSRYFNVLQGSNRCPNYICTLLRGKFNKTNVRGNSGLLPSRETRKSGLFLPLLVAIERCGGACLRWNK